MPNMKPKRQKKDRWADLPGEFREMIAGASDEKIYQEIRDAAMFKVFLDEQKKEDQDLAEKKSAYDEAGAVYKDGQKVCNLKIAFGRETIRSRGRAVPGDEDVKIKKTA